MIKYKGKEPLEKILRKWSVITNFLKIKDEETKKIVSIYAEHYDNLKLNKSLFPNEQYNDMVVSDATLLPNNLRLLKELNLKEKNIILTETILDEILLYEKEIKTDKEIDFENFTKDLNVDELEKSGIKSIIKSLTSELITKDNIEIHTLISSIQVMSDDGNVPIKFLIYGRFKIY